VLKLTLFPGKYSWEFIPVPGKAFRDSGEGVCHTSATQPRD
jgi:acid phosphatase type 7